MSSGDLLAERRLDYARALLETGDAAAAADLLSQTIPLVPDYAPAWFTLGEAHEALGEIAAAADAFRRCGELDGGDRLGAPLRLARLDGATPLSMPPAYVAALFDQYAARFDAALTERLQYTAPAQLRDAVLRACSLLAREPRFDHAVDLGCGTGLSGAAIRPLVTRLDGIDLSAEMVRHAETKHLYDRLTTGEALSALLRSAPGSLELVMAADVFVYLGDLSPIVSAAARALKAGGLLAFTVERHYGPGFILGAKLRYGHGRPHVEAAAAGAGLTTVLLEEVSTRHEEGIPTPGLLAVLGKT